LQPVGVHVAEISTLEVISAGGYQDLKEVAIPRLHEANRRVELFSAGAPSPRVSGAWSYLQAHGWLIEHEPAPQGLNSGYRTLGSAWIHESARVDARVRLIGPAMVGPRTRIAADTVLVGPISIGEECQIEEGTVLSRSAIWNSCTVGRSARIDASILVHQAAVARGETLRGAVVAPALNQSRARCRTALAPGTGPLTMRPRAAIVIPA